jgi:hypothetical protein
VICRPQPCSTKFASTLVRLLGGCAHPRPEHEALFAVTVPMDERRIAHLCGGFMGVLFLLCMILNAIAL